MKPLWPTRSVKPRTRRRLPGDRAYERRPDDRGQTPGHGDDRNDQLRRVTERRVQEAADPGTGMAGQVVRRLADEPGKRNQRRAGKHEQCQLADGAEPIQNHDERRQQQRQERTASDVPTGPAHALTLLGDARSPAFSRSRPDRQLAREASDAVGGGMICSASDCPCHADGHEFTDALSRPSGQGSGAPHPACTPRPNQFHPSRAARGSSLR